MLNDHYIKKIIYLVSTLIPLVVCVLIFLPIRPNNTLGFDIYLLPTLHAILNATTSLLLLGALIAIKNKKVDLHKFLNFASAFLSLLFLISYVIYHTFASSTKYGDMDKNGLLDDQETMTVGGLRYVYYFFLLTHILLAMVVIPYVAYSFYYALTAQGNFSKHIKLSKKTWMIWFYVSISGVIVYLMIKRYY